MNAKSKYVSLLSTVMLLLAIFVPFTASAAGEAAPRPQLTIGRLDIPPTIDGVYNASEWGTKSFTMAEAQPNITVHHSKVKNADGTETDQPIEATTTDVYTGYDDTHFYLCVVATYKNHVADALLGSQIWTKDCIQTKLAATPDGPNYNDIDFGFNATTKMALGYVWNGHGVTASNLKAGNNKDFMVSRTGDTTIYEISYPLASFASTTVKLKKGDKMAFSMAQHMNAGGFYEYAGGVVLTKDIASAAIFTLGDSKGLSGGTTPGVTSNTNATTSKGGTNATTSGGSNSSGIAATSGGEVTVSDTSDTSSNTDAIDENESQSDSSSEMTDSENQESNTLGWIIGIIAAVVIIIGAAFYFLIIRKK